MTDLSLDTWITIKDDTRKLNLPYFDYRISCNHKVNGELELLRSILKNKPSATVFDIGATGSQFPSEIDSTMSVHLFDPDFKPSGPAFKDDSTYTMYKEPVDYDKPNVYVNKYALNDTTQTLSDYCKTLDISHIDFLKIDTDGHDLAVLDGLGNVSVDVIQFEYDNFYRKHDLDTNVMFDRLKDWHFFYILPSGILPITKMRDDYIYTNILASKIYPSKIINDYKPLMKDTIVETDDVGVFLSEVFWEARHISPSVFKNTHCIPNEADDAIDPNWNLVNRMNRYKRIYDN